MYLIQTGNLRQAQSNSITIDPWPASQPYYSRILPQDPRHRHRYYQSGKNLSSRWAAKIDLTQISAIWISFPRR